MGTAVVFEADPARRAVKVWPAEEPLIVVVEGDLHLRWRKPGQDEEQAQTRFHRRLGIRLGQLDHSARLRHPRPP